MLRSSGNSMDSNSKVRADELLVRQKICETRSQARNLILSGKVFLNKELIEKPGKAFAGDSVFEVSAMPAFVSRAGEKLEGFLNHFKIDVTDKNGLDVGASTGGFTDCLLQRGASTVTCVDVGHGQLHAKLLSDPRVRNFEKINARELTSEQIGQKVFEIIVIDLSFISLKKVLPRVWNLLGCEGILIALIKPQFESTKEEVSRTSGIIKDPEIHERIVNDIIKFGEEELLGSSIIGWIASPIKGGDGNQEFLIGFRKKL